MAGAELQRAESDMNQQAGTGGGDAPAVSRHTVVLTGLGQVHSLMPRRVLQSEPGSMHCRLVEREQPDLVRQCQYEWPMRNNKRQGAAGSKAWLEVRDPPHLAVAEALACG